MIACLLLFAILGAQTPPEQLSTRVETPNGAIAYVDHIDGAKTVSLQLWSSARNCPETPLSHGWRHLLEHLLVRGRDGGLGGRIEALGGLLQASTYRDAMQIEISLPKDRVFSGLAALAEIVAPPKWSAADLAHAAKSIGHELAQEDDSLKLAGAAWSRFYGDAGLDPLGSMGAINAASPQDMTSLFADQFTAPCVALMVEGDVDVLKVAAETRAVLNLLPQGNALPWTPTPEPTPARVEVQDAFGEARAAACGRYGLLRTAGELASALLVASLVDDAFVTYTPSASPGVITIGRTTNDSGIGLLMDSLSDAQRRGLFPRAQTLALRWYERQVGSPDRLAAVRGALLCQDRSLRYDDMRQAILELTPEDFLKAMRAFEPPQAVVCLGVAR